MPPRGKAPGLKKGRTLKDGTILWYWIARNVVTDIRGFPDKCIALPRGADEAMRTELCHDHTARLKSYLQTFADDAAAGLKTQEERRNTILVASYTGTIASACTIYRNHTLSPFNEVAENTQKTYGDRLKVIEHDIGARVIRNITVVDAKRWYKEWRRPKRDGGKERIDRAHDTMTMLRQVIRWGVSLAFKDCVQLAERLAATTFERGSAREQEMTYAQAGAFVRTALSLGDRGVIPADRALVMAIGTAAQFELALRQRDIIGKWRAAIAATQHAVYDGEGEMWTGPFRWDNIPGWKFRLKTSKTRAPTGFALADYLLLFPLLERVPHAERTGAIIKGEHGLPVRARTYRRWFRDIARAAGIPDEVWNMDSRAGAATEADEAGVDFKLIQGLLTHSEKQPTTTERYFRRRERGNAEVAKARMEHRRKQADGETN